MTLNSRKGQLTNQKYRNLVGSDRQETELRKADRTVGVNCYKARIPVGAVRFVILEKFASAHLNQISREIIRKKVISFVLISWQERARRKLPHENEAESSVMRSQV